MREAVAALPADLGETTQFEVLTVAALLAFAESGVEAVALEAGLGGRLDATNVVEAPVVVLTNIGLEHTQVLGDTRELIFAEKAAVIKGGDAVFGPLDGLEDAARRVCSAAGAPPALPAAGDFAVGRATARRTSPSTLAGGEAWARPRRADAGALSGGERRPRRRGRAPAAGPPR